MRKEEILEKHLGGNFLGDNTKQCVYEFTKEIAIGFKKWSDKFYVETGFGLDETIYYSHVSYESEEKFTIEQLCNLYFQSLNPINK